MGSEFDEIDPLTSGSEQNVSSAFTEEFGWWDVAGFLLNTSAWSSCACEMSAAVPVKDLFHLSSLCGL